MSEDTTTITLTEQDCDELVFALEIAQDKSVLSVEKEAIWADLIHRISNVKYIKFDKTCPRCGADKIPTSNGVGSNFGQTHVCPNCPVGS